MAGIGASFSLPHLPATERRTAAQPWRRELVFMAPHLPFSILAGIGPIAWAAVVPFGIKSAPMWCSRQAEFHHILNRRSPYQTGLAR
jgi:hypothetical protein